LTDSPQRRLHFRAQIIAQPLFKRQGKPRFGRCTICSGNAPSQRSDEKAAAGYEAEAAVREAPVGIMALAKQQEPATRNLERQRWGGNVRHCAWKQVLSALSFLGERPLWCLHGSTPKLFGSFAFPEQVRAR
jgi:hypothetical protein